MVLSSEMSFESGITRSRMKAVKQLKQTNAQQLEAETKKMEERIRSLKEQMVREKEEREKGGGIRWVSGHAGPLTKNSQQGPKKKIPKADKKNPRKIKLLTDEPLSLYAKKATANDSVRDVSRGAIQTVCGQCDKSKATLGCVECAENYCVSCFTNFHQKGALKKHSTRPVGQVKTELEEKKQPVPPSLPRTTRSTTGRASRNGPPSTQKEGGLLLHGTFDEDESAASFAEALKQWRHTKPAETNKSRESQGTSCGTSTVPEAPKTVELKLNFGPNKSLNYLDRLLLKKHRENPARSSSMRQPTPKKAQLCQRQGAGSVNSAEEDYSLNYREIFQTLGKQSGNSKSVEEDGGRRYEKQPIIEELSEDAVNIEETTACVVEELGDSVPAEAAPAADRPVSRSGRVSIMSMTSGGNFVEETNALVLEDLSGSSNTPVFESRAPTTVNRAHSRWQKPSEEGSRRVWSPRPCYTGLSDFFLAGVKAMPLPKEIPGQQNLDAVVHSRPLLCRTVWIPHESVCATEAQLQGELESRSSSRGGEQCEAVPQIQEPAVENESASNVSVSYSPDPVYDDGLRASLELNDTVNSPRIHDFGIVDFLKTAPEPPKDDFTALHRVSTVTPFSLSPIPPLHWSDDESDDDVLAKVINQSPEGFDKAAQDADDRATLDDLAWELASTTGRLTQCTLDGTDSPRDDDSCDEDSIEENDRGSGLSSPDELNLDSADKAATELDRLDDEELQSEVRALR